MIVNTERKYSNNFRKHHKLPMLRGNTKRKFGKAMSIILDECYIFSLTAGKNESINPFNV